MELFAEKSLNENCLSLILMTFDESISQQNYCPNMLFGNQKSTEWVLSTVNESLVLRAGHVQFEIIVIGECRLIGFET